MVVENIYDNIKLLSMDITESNYLYGDITSLKNSTDNETRKSLTKFVDLEN